MHLLSPAHYSEFQATPSLVRLTAIQGERGDFQPTMLIKADSLALKYLTIATGCRLLVCRLADDRIAYAVEVQDDPSAPAMIWSVLESEDEFEVLRVAATGRQCKVFLFNELSVSVAHSRQKFNVVEGDIKATLAGFTYANQSARHSEAPISEAFHAIHKRVMPTDRYAILVSSSKEWTTYQVHHLNNAGQASMLSISDRDEGSQQEQLGSWLVDNLLPTGVIRNPSVSENGKSRELTDLLLTHEYGVFLFESKSLSVFGRPSLPDRTKLGHDLVKHVKQAARQLTGAVRSVQRGLDLADEHGKRILISKTENPHAVILVPDTSLLSGATELDIEFYYRFVNTTRGFFQILDPAELLRVVQAAEYVIAAGAGSVTPIMAFDYFLMRRAQYASTAPDPSFEYLFRAE